MQNIMIITFLINQNRIKTSIQLHYVKDYFYYYNQSNNFIKKQRIMNSTFSNLQQQQLPYGVIFDETQWHKLLPKKYLLPTQFIQFDQEDIEFFINDCTKPDFSQLKKKQQIDLIIKDNLNGAGFVKICGRTAKDLPQTMMKILNAEDLTLAIKMSEFLTEVIDQQIQLQKQQINSTQPFHLSFTFRQHKNYLQSSIDQYRVYLIDGQMVGMCQKVTNHISVQPNENQIKKAYELVNKINIAVHNIIKSNKQQNYDKPVQLVVDCFILQDGKKAKILSIDPLQPIHCLSLFAVDEIRTHYNKIRTNQNKNEIQPLLQWIRDQKQYKEVDLRSYRLGAELEDVGALEEWKQFIKGK